MQPIIVEKSDSEVFFFFTSFSWCRHNLRGERRVSKLYTNPEERDENSFAILKSKTKKYSGSQLPYLFVYDSSVTEMGSLLPSPLLSSSSL